MTTSILGDVVGELVGDQAQVITIMPAGADPHEFQASAQEVDQLLAADALVVNGSGFEEGLLDVIESAVAEGVPTFEATSAVETLEFGAGGHGHDDEEGHSDEEAHADEEEGHKDEEGHSEEDGHSDDEEGHSEEEGHEDEEGRSEEEGHSDEEEGHEDEEGHSDEEVHADEEEGHDDEEAHSDEEEAHEDEDVHEDEEGHDEHDHEGVDPHFFTDPARMMDAVRGISSFLEAEVSGLDEEALDAAVDDYIARLEALDGEVEELVAAIPEAQRVLVTNHEVFAYFADRYGFEVIGAVIPSGTTGDSASAGELAELAEIIEAEGVPAIFSDTSSSSSLVDTLAAEVGDVAVVELYTESLGEPGSEGGTYLDMVRTNATRISDALA
ncbi:MAG: metal ABC transporter solute-binding protein, Zn/Mn family [Acidimicrobiales bacterium]